MQVENNLFTPISEMATLYQISSMKTLFEYLASLEYVPSYCDSLWEKGKFHA